MQEDVPCSPAAAPGPRCPQRGRGPSTFSVATLLRAGAGVMGEGAVGLRSLGLAGQGWPLGGPGRIDPEPNRESERHRDTKERRTRGAGPEPPGVEGVVRIRPRGTRRTGAALLGVRGWEPPRSSRCPWCCLQGSSRDWRGGAGWKGWGLGGSVGTGGKAAGGASFTLEGSWTRCLWAGGGVAGLGAEPGLTASLCGWAGGGAAGEPLPPHLPSLPVPFGRVAEPYPAVRLVLCRRWGCSP